MFDFLERYHSGTVSRSEDGDDFLEASKSYICSLGAKTVGSVVMLRWFFRSKSHTANFMAHVMQIISIWDHL